MDAAVPLSQLKKGEKALVWKIVEENDESNSSFSKKELVRRLLEMGFMEGTEVSVQHTGPVGQDPMAVLIRTCSMVALRKKEAASILVKKVI